MNGKCEARTRTDVRCQLESKFDITILYNNGSSPRAKEVCRSCLGNETERYLASDNIDTVIVRKIDA